MGLYKKIEFADMVCTMPGNSQKYNVKRNSSLQAKTLFGTHRIKEVGCALFGRLPRP